MKKELWIVTGPNGAGKSTLVERFNSQSLPVVNPDLIAATLAGHTEQEKHLTAGRMALKERQRLLNKGDSFIFETTFSGKGGLALISNAKAKGYKVKLAFVGLEVPALSLMRVGTRVQGGGHSVPTADINRRFERVFQNVKEALPLCDRAYVLDNSRRAPLIVAKLRRGKVVRKYPIKGKWILDRFPILKKGPQKSLRL